MDRKFKKLNVRIVEKCDTQGKFAEKMGISESLISAKLNGRINWKSNEIERAMEVLDIKKSQIAEYFFPNTLK